MRVFISFASEQRETAELTAMALRDRGHSVFFSKDTLPAAQSFDVRIEQAIKSSDLFVFLISPESVTRGKYTLTELAFAREKWANPAGHVLPVMIAPTPIAAIPVYLRAISIFEPEGNLAAEIAAQINKVLPRSSKRTVVNYALGGAATGLLSFLMLQYLPLLQFPFIISNTARIGPTGVSPMPGLLFGGLIALCNFNFGIRDRFQLGTIIIFIVLSWVLATNTAWATFDIMSDYIKQPTLSVPMPEPAPPALQSDDSSPAPAAKGTNPLYFVAALAGMIGGLVGSFGTVLGVAIVNPQLRALEQLVPIVLVAAAIGALVALKDTDFGINDLLVLVVWQAAVAAMIARVLFAAKVKV